MDGPLEVAQGLRVEPELRHVELEVRLVEEAEDDLLAPQSRQDAHAKVHLASLAELQLDASVLREAALGDVELAHDLEAAGDRVLQLERRRHLVDEHAVDAVADAELLLVGLAVDVARALLDGVEQDHVDEPNNGRILARLLELHQVELFALRAELDLFFVEAGHHLFVRGAVLVKAFDGRLDGRFGGDDRLDVEAGQKLDVVDGVEVRRIGHRHDERRSGARDRDDLVLVADVLRDELQNVLIDLVLVEVDGRDAVLRRKEIGYFAVGDVAELGERRAEVLAGSPLFVLRLS